MEQQEKELRKATITLTITAMIIAMLVIAYNHYARQYHTCTDPTHERCDGECPCDGFECPPIKADSHATQQCDYHLTIIDDTYIMIDYAGDTVKIFKYGEMPVLDSVVDADNL